MSWKKILLSLLFLLNLVESSGRSVDMWLINLGSGPTLLYSWTICSAGIFVLVALVLSTYLIFEHLAAYNQPEVRPCMNWIVFASLVASSFVQNLFFSPVLYCTIILHFFLKKITLFLFFNLMFHSYSGASFVAC